MWSSLMLKFGWNNVPLEKPINKDETTKRLCSIQSTTYMLENKEDAPCETVDLKKEVPSFTDSTFLRNKLTHSLLPFFNDIEVKKELQSYHKIYLHDSRCYVHYVIENTSGQENIHVGVNISSL